MHAYTNNFFKNLDWYWRNAYLYLSRGFKPIETNLIYPTKNFDKRSPTNNEVGELFLLEI